VNSKVSFTKGISSFAELAHHDRAWVTSELLRALSLGQRRALQDFSSSMQSYEKKLRAGLSVFVSHSSRDKRFVRSLKKYLEEHGVRVWLDEANLFPGEALFDRLSESILRTDLLIAVLSNHSIRSNWVKKELALAAQAEVDGRKVKIVPILKDDCEVPHFLADKLHLDFRTASARRKNEPVLLDALMKLSSRRGTSKRRLSRQTTKEKVGKTLPKLR